MLNAYKAKLTELLLLTNSEIMAFSKKTKVHFFSHDTRPNLRNTVDLRHFIKSIFRKEGKVLHSINYVFCSDEVLLRINKEYLDHDFYTDVITFNLSSDSETISAEVYISIDRVRENAKKLKGSITSELHRVIFHATLHLCGYNDKTKKDLETMRALEDKLLHNYFGR